MSVLASNNDEILLLIYPVIDSSRLGSCVLSNYHVFDTANCEILLDWNIKDYTQPRYLIALIEEDSDNPGDQITRKVAMDLRRPIERQFDSRRSLVLFQISFQWMR